MGIFSRKPKSDTSQLKDASFYFYFVDDKKLDAEKAEKELAAKGFKTDLHWIDYGGGQWSLTLSKQVTGLDEIDGLEKDFEAIAQKYNCEYDGHEIAI